MTKLMIVLCALVACVAGHPGVVAPLGVAPLGYPAPLAYSSPLGYSAALTYATPYGYSFAPGGSSRIDIQNNFARQYAVAVPAPFAGAPLRYSTPVGIAGPVALPTPLAAAPVAVPAPLGYNAPVLTPFSGIAAPVAGAPLAKIAAPVAVPAPLAAAPLRYSAPVATAPLAKIAAPVAVPAPLAAAPLRYSAPVVAPFGGIAAPVAAAPLSKIAAPVAVPAPLAYNAPLLASNVLNRYTPAFYGAPLSYAFPAGLPLTARFSAATLPQFGAPLAAGPVPLAAPEAFERLRAVPAATDDARAPIPSDSEQVSDKLAEVPTAADDQVTATPAPVDADSPAVVRSASDVTQSPVAPVRNN